MCSCWVLFVHISKGVNCRWLPTEISNRENDDIETGKSGEYLRICSIGKWAPHTFLSFFSHISQFRNENVRIFLKFSFIFEVVDGKQHRSSELQLEKSILSHDQGEIQKPSQKQRTQEGRMQKRRRQRRKHQQQRPHKIQRKKKRQLDNRIRAHYFDAFEADYVDFGALIGQNGAFSWHANYSPD